MAKPKHTFRRGKSQAKLVAATLAAHGESRHTGKASGNSAKIEGIGTERGVKQALSQFAEWLHQERRGDLMTADRQAAIDYLEQRSESVRQATLNLDRQSLDRLQHLNHGPAAEPLPKVQSELETIKNTRAYTPAQLSAIAGAMSEKHQVTTLLAWHCGIRAHEAATVRIAALQPRSSHREWNPRRFDGPDGVRPPGALYTVCGKGGLVRELWIPAWLVLRLEARRLTVPEPVVDRGVRYTRHYSLGFGQSWSQAFTSASKRTLGWSNGGHGARHTYVQALVASLQSYGWGYHEARRAAAMCTGHFRESVIDFYLR